MHVLELERVAAEGVVGHFVQCAILPFGTLSDRDLQISFSLHGNSHCPIHPFREWADHKRQASFGKYNGFLGHPVWTP